MKMKSILSGLTMVCAACMFLAASYSQAANKPTKEITITTVRYVVLNVDAASFGFAIYAQAGRMTTGRARATGAAAVGLISMVIGALALRATRRRGTGNARAIAIVALVLGLISIVYSVVHLGTSTGGFGTGGGRAGAIVGLVLGLIGMIHGGLALARSRGKHLAKPTQNGDEG